jgi:hypothetical protein
MLYHTLKVSMLHRHHFQLDVGLTADSPYLSEIILPRTLVKVGKLILKPNLEIKRRNIVALLRQETESHRTIDPTRG